LIAGDVNWLEQQQEGSLGALVSRFL